MFSLSDHFLFDGADPETAASVTDDERACIKSYCAGDSIFGRDHFSRSLGIITRGSAIVRKGGGSHGVIMRRIRESDSFGAAALFCDEWRYVSEIVAESDCTVLFLPQELLCEIMQRDFSVAMNYIRFQSERINFLNLLVEGYSAQSAEGKLARFLIANANGDTVSPDFNMVRLSEMLGIGRASLYRVIAAMENDGLIRREGKKIRLINLEALAAL